MPRDPTKSFRNMKTMDSAAVQEGFDSAVSDIVFEAMKSSIVIVACSKGLHRSPVAAAGAAEILKFLGYAVVVVEMQLVQPFLYAPMLATAQDDRL